MTQSCKPCARLVCAQQPNRLDLHVFQGSDGQGEGAKNNLDFSCHSLKVGDWVSAGILQLNSVPKTLLDIIATSS